MKNIKNYNAKKYDDEKNYKKIEDGIYKYRDNDEIIYVSSISFEQEANYEEGENADEISQYPLEDILDKFYCYISDFYKDINTSDSKICYLEFAATDIDSIKSLRSIIGKHVYSKANEDSVELVIE